MNHDPPTPSHIATGPLNGSPSGPPPCWRRDTYSANVDTLGGQLPEILNHNAASLRDCVGRYTRTCVPTDREWELH